MRYEVRLLGAKSPAALWLLIIAILVLPSCGGYINNPAPVLRSINPASVTAGQPGFTLQAIGNNFAPGSLIELTPPNGSPTPLVTVFTNINLISTQITSAQIQNPGAFQVTVFTQQPGGGTSISVPFTVNPSVSPVPSIQSLSPSQMTAGASAANLIVTGTGFVAQSTISVNGNNLPTIFGDSTSVSATLPSTVLAAAGTLQIAVINPPPGGGSSNPISLPVVNPIPTISALSPSSVQAGAAAPSLAVTGVGFVTSSVVEVNGAPRPTSFASGTSVSTQLTAADVANGGVDQITVVNQTPSGTSNILPFSVNATPSIGLPEIVDLAPDGSQANNGICGGLSNCNSGSLGLTLTTSGPSISETGSFVAYASVSTNLITGGTAASSDIFLRTTCLGNSASCNVSTAVQSTDPNGGPANGASSEPSLSETGDDVAFTSRATNLVISVPLNGATRQIFWRPTCTTAPSCATTTGPGTQLVSISADGSTGGNGDSSSPSISPDGRYVAFVSLATNLVSNVTPDGFTPQVYVRDTCNGVASTTCTPSTTLVSSPDGKTPGDGQSLQPAIADTTEVFVAFSSTATNLINPSAPSGNGFQQIFERAQCIQGATSCTATTALVSSPDGVALANGASIEPAISGDGRFVAFASTGTNLIPGAGPTQEIFVRDTCTGQASSACAPITSLVSTQNGSIPANAICEHPTINQSTGAITGQTSGTPTPVDGQVIAFASKATNLAANAANGVENIYVRNTCEGISTTSTSTTPCSASTILASQPRGPSPPPANDNSLVPVVAADGHVVTFLSFASNLVLRDNNDLEDIFLASTTF